MTSDAATLAKLTDVERQLLEDLSHRKVSAVYPQAWWCRARIERGRMTTPFDAGDET